MDTGRKLSTSGIYRLALYNRYVSGLSKIRNEYVSSQELAEATGHTAAQVRKDRTFSVVAPELLQTRPPIAGRPRQRPTWLRIHDVSFPLLIAP